MPPKRQGSQRGRPRANKATKKQLPKQPLIQEITETLDSIPKSNGLSGKSVNYTEEQKEVLSNETFDKVMSACRTYCKELGGKIDTANKSIPDSGKVQASFLLGNTECKLLKNHIFEKYNGKLEDKFKITKFEICQDPKSLVSVVDNEVRVVCDYKDDDINSYYDSIGNVTCTILYIIFYLFSLTGQMINPDYIADFAESNYDLNLLINKYDYLENEKSLNNSNSLSKFINNSTFLQRFSVSENETFEFSNYLTILMKGNLTALCKCIIHLLTNYFPQSEQKQQNKEKVSTLREFCQNRCNFSSNQDDLNDEFSDVRLALQNLLFKDYKYLRVPYTGIYKDPDLILHLDDDEIDEEDKTNREAIQSSRIKMVQYIQKMQEQV